MAVMKVFAGVGASVGIGCGTVHLLARRLAVVDRVISRGQVPGELARLDVAVADTDSQLVRIAAEVPPAEGEQARLVLEAHRLMLRSRELLESAADLIRDGCVGAECAVRRTVDRILVVFARMADPYLRERGADVEAVGERLLGALLGRPGNVARTGEAAGRVAVGELLSPLDALQLGQARLAAVVTERGGQTSHAAIIARSLKLPYVFGVRGMLRDVRAGDRLLVDGERGEVVVNPDAETLADFAARAHRRRGRSAALRARPAGVTRTRDGVRVELSANIDSRADLVEAAEVHADSIGLFRTELLYLDRAVLPSEEEQYADAVAALKVLDGRSATFRTLDLGGDKVPAGGERLHRACSSLGVRAIRLSLARPDLFRTQLRALYRASAFGPLRIMFPMVSSVTELEEAQALCRTVRGELRAEGAQFREHTPIGVMLETPSAVLTADHLARHCDFFSLGTNDLIQYAFAVDREDDEVRALASPFHPAVLRLLKLSVDVSAVSGTRISICGNLAGDPEFSWLLIGLGLRELSMAPSCIPAVRALIEGTRLAHAQALVTAAQQLDSAGTVHALVLDTMQGAFPGLRTGDYGASPAWRPSSTSERSATEAMTGPIQPSRPTSSTDSPAA